MGDRQPQVLVLLVGDVDLHSVDALVLHERRNIESPTVLSIIRAVLAIVSFLEAGACGAYEAGRADSAALQQTSTGPVLRITILGDSADPRIPPAREALEHWNGDFRRLGRRVQLALIDVRPNDIPDDVVRAAGGEAVIGGGPATDRLLGMLANDSSDIVIVLTHDDLISFSVPWRRGRKGLVGMRRSDILPLSLPNTVRNVVAHELGHVLGLAHNADSTTLMCGRPAPCRPAAFASDSGHFFPLTAPDGQRIRQRWP